MQPASIERLVAELGRMPGVGARTAQRLAYHLLTTREEHARNLAAAIVDVRDRIGECEVCFDLAEGPRCEICRDARRDDHVLCVVEGPADVLPMERTLEFRGRYHVLGGALSPMDGVGPQDLHLDALYRRVAALDEGGARTVREVVLATNPTTTGEATALHVAAALRERAPDVEVSRLASGLPVGADLEYTDEVTLGRALAGRRRL